MSTKKDNMVNNYGLLLINDQRFQKGLERQISVYVNHTPDNNLSHWFHLYFP
jgi:hypothetical protein